MADKKISELDAITGANTAADDFFIVVDSSGSTTKKISRAELNNAIERDVLSTVDVDGGTIDGTIVGGETAAAGTFTDLTVTGTVTGITEATGNELENIVEDTTPQLGGNLDLNNFNITGTGDIPSANLTGALPAIDGSALTGIASDVVNDTTPQLGGNLDTNGNDINFGDNDKAIFGAGSDLQIYHDGSNSLVYEGGSGSLYLGTNGSEVALMGNSNSEYMVQGTSNGAVNLYYDNSKKFETTSTGVDVTGDIDMDEAGGDSYLRQNNEIVVGRSDGSNFVRLGSSSATDYLRLFAGGAERLRITSTGNVGIGTSSPSSTLDVEGELMVTGGGSGTILVNDEDSSLCPTMTFTRNGAGTVTNGFLKFENSGGQVAEINATGGGYFLGNVGIGTSSPTASVPLTIVSDSGNAIAQNIRGRSDGIGVLLFSDNSDVENGRIDFRTTYAEIKQTRNAPLAFSTNNIERMRIDSSGNLGIGTTSPDSALHVYKQTNDRSARFQRISSQYIDITQTSGVNEIKSTGKDFEIGTTDALNLKFDTNGTERMRIDSSGNLLVGKTATFSSGSHTLEATGDVAALDVYTASTVTGRNVFNVRSDVNGTGAVVGAVEANGDFQSASNSYGSISDERIKQDIVDSSSQYEDVKNMRLRKYKLKAHVEAMGEDAPEHLGVVAQELEASGMSGLVKTDPDSGIKSVRYSIMYLKAIGALQEAITKIEALEEENIAIKARIAALEAN